MRIATQALAAVDHWVTHRVRHVTLQRLRDTDSGQSTGRPLWISFETRGFQTLFIIHLIALLVLSWARSSWSHNSYRLYIKHRTIHFWVHSEWIRFSLASKNLSDNDDDDISFEYLTIQWWENHIIKVMKYRGTSTRHSHLLIIWDLLQSTWAGEGNQHISLFFVFTSNIQIRKISIEKKLFNL